MTVKRESDCQAPVVEGPDADTDNETFSKRIVGHTEGTAQSIRPSSVEVKKKKQRLVRVLYPNRAPRECLRPPPPQGQTK